MMPTRQTRRRIAYWDCGVLTIIILRLILPWDITPQSGSVLMILVPSLTTLLVAFVTGEAVSDHSERKHGGAK